jgi:hypothetical protein
VSAKHHHKPPRLVEVDVDLDNACDEFRRRCEQLEHGMVYAVVARHGSMTIDYKVQQTSSLPGDIERVMRGKPGWDK